MTTLDEIRERAKEETSDEAAWARDRAMRHNIPYPKLRRLIYVCVQYGFACAYCGRPMKFFAGDDIANATLEHELPAYIRNREGIVGPLLIVCWGCNQVKRTILPDLWKNITEQVNQESLHQFIDTAFQNFASSHQARDSVLGKLRAAKHRNIRESLTALVSEELDDLIKMRGWNRIEWNGFSTTERELSHQADLERVARGRVILLDLPEYQVLGTSLAKKPDIYCKRKTGGLHGSIVQENICSHIHGLRIQSKTGGER